MASFFVEQGTVRIHLSIVFFEGLCELAVLCILKVTYFAFPVIDASLCAHYKNIAN